MNKTPFFFKALFCWLIPVMVLFGSLSPAQKAQAAASPCTADYFHQGLITADETWCAGATHYMTGDVIVQPGVTLTIAAGVMVDSVEAAWSKYLTVQGHLDINGTLAQPVLLTRSINYPIQNWSGLYFDGSQGDGSGTINYAVIEHAGSNFLPSGCTGTCGNGQTAVFVKDLSVGKQVTINNSTLRDNVSKGLYVVDSTVNVTNTTFSQNKYPILIDGASSVVTYSGNTFSNNAYPYYDNVNYTVQEDAIFINPGALMGHNFSLPVQNGLDAYVMWGHTTIPAGVTMSVEPGVTLRKEWGNYLTVQGHLDALGTQALPIRFTGIPGSDTVIHNWGGLYFEGTAGDGSGTLSHVTIERGGSNFLPPSCVGICGTAQTAVFIKDLPANKQVNISSSIIENSLGKGLYVVNSSTAHVDGNLIKGGRVGAHFVSNMTVNNLAVIDQVLYGIMVETGYSVDARHLTIARAGQIGFYTGGTSLLKNSILSHNALAVKAEGSGQASLDTNLADANTIFKSGTVSELHPINGSAAFEADGYHIQATSEAVGNGLPSLSVVDIDGNTRPSPLGSLPDLGADEISAGTSALPRVISSTRFNTNPTNLAIVNFTVTFSEPVTSVNDSDFTLTKTGSVSGMTVSGVSGTGSVYTVTVNTGNGNGTIRLNVIDNNSIFDAALNPLGGAAIGDGNFTTGEVYTINKGGDTTGVFRPGNGLLYLKNANTTGFADVAINYGTGGDYPIAGDWDGNGTATIGIYRNGSFYLRNSNTLGFADIVFAFGTTGDQPVAGDWDGDGVDTIGVYSNGQFLLRNSNSAGVADMSFYLGNPGDVGIAGDWNGDGMDTTGVFRPSNGIIFLKNANTTGFADAALNYGLAGDMPVTGDWNNDGIDTIGVYRNAQFLLRNSNTIGFAEIVFGLGNPGDMPISGNWDGIP